eukprot:9451719-Karenia_brevis.AAC.1
MACQLGKAFSTACSNRSWQRMPSDVLPHEFAVEPQSSMEGSSPVDWSTSISRMALKIKDFAPCRSMSLPAV